MKTFKIIFSVSSLHIFNELTPRRRTVWFKTRHTR